MNKSKFCFLLITLSLLFSSAACAPSGGSSQKGYDGRVFDISENQDESLLATSTKVGNYYSLSISGTGKAKDYTRKEEVPWNPIVKKITSVTINDGITHIGDYSFISLTLEYFILPSTVTSVGDNAFSGNSVIYTYGSELTNIDNEIYYYSETKPDEFNKYFYMDGDNPVVWAYTRVLFIGNSFTYFRESVEYPAVPKYFERIATNLNQEVDVDFVVKGSHSLTKFGNPTDECGRVVEQYLTTKEYDVVFLQEHSTTPISNYDTFNKAVAKLKKRISETQDDCDTILYQTWGFPSYIADYDKFETVADMELALREAYEQCASENDCGIHYVGKAFIDAYTNHPDIPIYHTDDKHQSNLGAFLSAAVHVRSLFGVNVTRCTDYCDLSTNKDYVDKDPNFINQCCETLLEVANKII